MSHGLHFPDGGTPRRHGRIRAALLPVCCALWFLGVANAALRIGTGSLPDGTVGVLYSEGLSARGGPEPFTWSLQAGSLPPGLDLDSASGQISGMPTAAGNFAFTVKVTDASAQTDTQGLHINVHPNPVHVTTTSLGPATVGSPYSQQLGASGGIPPYQWSVSAGSLPAGLNLSSSGAISGTPTAAGTSNFTVRATDSNNSSDTQGLSVAVKPSPLTVATTALAAGTAGTPYSATLSASGGTGGYSWSVSAGTLPGGLSLNGSSITGAPSAAGTSNFTVQVRDMSGATATQALTLTINPAPLIISTGSLSNGTAGTPYSATLSASGGTGGYTWSVSSGTLSAGLSLNGSSITGTPTAAGTSNFTVQVRDSSGANASKPLTITINPAPLMITTTSLPNGTVGAPYSATLAANGTGVITWSIASGALPDGLSINGSAITGSPTAAGLFNFTVQAANSNATATKPLSITINPAPLTITTTSLPNGTVGTAYSAT
ncbi:MAG TPA: putative Ig domain-containing protein, partial [Bryobacteraceae bacterium]